MDDILFRRGINKFEELFPLKLIRSFKIYGPCKQYPKIMSKSRIYVLKHKHFDKTFECRGKNFKATTSENVSSHLSAQRRNIQISLCTTAVQSESSLGVFLITKDAKFLHADNEDSDQTARMRRLI